MPPVPKRKHSSRRTGKRRAALPRPHVTLSQCRHCGSVKEPHVKCRNCGQY